MKAMQLLTIAVTLTGAALLTVTPLFGWALLIGGILAFAVTRMLQ